jgi:uncharacterized protein YkvS
MDNAELNRVVDAVKQRRTYNARNITRKLMVGDIVSFEERKGATVTGRVMKVNPKTVVVKDSATAIQWKVTATLLTPLSIGA